MKTLMRFSMIFIFVLIESSCHSFELRQSKIINHIGIVLYQTLKTLYFSINLHQLHLSLIKQYVLFPTRYLKLII